MTWLRGLSGYQRLGLVTILGLLALVTLGGTVRVTDSGLACPDWPLCNGKIIPEGDYHIWIEWTHRLVASLMGFVILAFVIGAVRKFRDRPWVVAPAVVGIIVLGVQVVLGGLTVTEELPAGIVTAHLGTAMVIVLLMLVAWMATFVKAREPGEPRPPARADAAEQRLAKMAVISGVGLLALLLLGSYVSGSNAGFFCDQDWPLCNGSLLPEGRLPGIHMAHRYLAAFEGLLLLATWTMAWRLRGTATEVFRLATLVAVLYGVQVVLGAVIMWTALEEWSRVVHMAAAALTWGSAVGLMAFAVRRSGRFPSVDERRSMQGLFPPRFQLRETRSSD